MRSSAQSSHFGATRNGEEILTYPISGDISTGISFDDSVWVAYGMVNEYEEREAAVTCLVSWTEWIKLSRSERAAGIAHFRLRRVIEVNINDALTKAIKRKQRNANG